MQVRRSARFFAPVSLLALAACSGGGGTGGGMANGPVVTPPPPPSVNITGVTAMGYGGATPTEATSPSTPTLALPTAAYGTAFAMDQAALSINSTSASGVNAGAGTLVLQRYTISHGSGQPVVDLKIPNLSIDATGLIGDGTAIALPNGGGISIAISSLNYSLLGAWTFRPASNDKDIIGMAVAGYQTPASSVPTTGTATYLGDSDGITGRLGSVVGSVAVPSGTGTVAAATLFGEVSVNVDFATQKVTGSFKNMKATDTRSGTITPWNDVTLTGTLSQGAGSSAHGAVITGTTQAQAAPSGAAFGMSSNASGTLSGALFGPFYQEASAVWSLNEGSGATGKTAFGVFGADKK